MIQSHNKFLASFASLVLAVLLVSCGQAGTSGGSSCGVCGADTDIKGSITSQFGSSAQMKGWVVVFLEKLTGIARVAEVDNAGLYAIKNVKSSVAQTIVLLSPDYIVQSVLSIPPKTTSAAIRQYFKINSSILPQLIHKGPIIQFQETAGISVTNDLAADADSDGIPDGSTGESALWLQAGTQLNEAHLEGFGGFQLAGVDQDLDGTPNSSDTDIDGDGIANIMDSDDDGDKIRDVFDGDADGDLENDELATQGDQFFDEGVDYVAVQYQKKPNTAGTGFDITLTFTTRVKDNVSPIAVQVRGAPTLLNNAMLQTTNSEDETAETVWNRLLKDDGLSQDKLANDRVFGAQVKLSDGLAPRHHEVLFFQLVFGSTANPWYLEFPFAFPDITPGTVTSSYASKIVTLLSLGAKGPFGDIENYKWAVNLFAEETDEDGETVTKNQWSSEATDGTTTSITIPDNQFTTGKTYTYEVVAQVLAKVNGLPAYTIYSSTGSISTD